MPEKRAYRSNTRLFIKTQIDCVLKFTNLKIAKDTMGGMRTKRREGGEGKEEAVEERGVRV